MASIAILGALLLVFFWRYITPFASARILFPDGDFIEQFYPWRHYAASELGHGRLPLWTPFANSGHPFLADIQTAVLYPLHLLMGLLLRLVGDAQLTLLELEWLAILHFALAGGFTYLFVKQQTGSRLGGIGSALIFTFGGYLTSYPALQLSVLETVVWMPLALFVAAMAVSRRSLLLWAALGVVLTTSVLGGHPQQATYLYYLVVGFSLFTILASASREGGPALKIAASCLPHLGGLTLALVISVALASAQLFPTWDLISFSSRGDELGYRFVQEGFGFKEGLGLLFPDFWGGRALFIGSVPILLITVSLWRPRYRGAIFWACTALVALLLSFGGSLPVYDFAHCCLPGFSWFRDQERAASVVSFAGSILSGYGLASALAWVESKREARLRILARMAAILAGAAALLAAASYLSGVLTPSLEASNLVRDAATMAMVLGLAATTVYVVIRRRAGTPLAMAGLVALAVAQLMVVNWGSFEPGGTDHFEATPLTTFLQTLPADRRIELTALPTNLGYIYRLRSTRGAGPLANKYYANVMEGSGSWKAWQLLNTGYVVGNARDGAQDARPVFSHEGRAVYETGYSSLPAYVSFRPRVETDDQAVIDALRHSGDGFSGDGFKAGRDALLSEDPGMPLTGRGYVRSLQVAQDEAGYMVARLDLTEPGVLVLSEVDSPGWKALLDGKEARILRVNYLLRGIAIPAGPHVVQLSYQPESAKVGFIVSLAALFLVLAIAAVSLPVRPGWKRTGIAALLVATAITATMSWHALSSFPKEAEPGPLEQMSQFIEAGRQPGDRIAAPSGKVPPTLDLPVEVPPASGTLASPGRVWWISSPETAGSGPPRPHPVDGLQVVEERWFGNHLLSLLAPPQSIIASAPRKSDAVLDSRIALRGYSTSLKAGAGEAAGTMEVHLYWQALEGLQDDYTIFVHLLDREGRVISQDDAAPQAGARPTSGWEPQEAIVDWHILKLPRALAAGDTLIAGVYDSLDGKRLGDGNAMNYIPLSIGQP